MKIEELTICPALFSCYIAKKNKNGTMSQSRKELSKGELEEAVVWYAKNYLEPNTRITFSFKDGSVVEVAFKEGEKKN